MQNMIKTLEKSRVHTCVTVRISRQLLISAGGIWPSWERIRVNVISLLLCI